MNSKVCADHEVSAFNIVYGGNGIFQATLNERDRDRNVSINMAIVVSPIRGSFAATRHTVIFVGLTIAVVVDFIGADLISTREDRRVGVIAVAITHARWANPW